MTNNGQDLVERYIYQVIKRMPEKQRADVAEELRTLIADMLEARGADEGQEAVKEVLSELGPPSSFGEKYGDSQYLIGPSVFPTYKLVLGIVLAACAFGSLLASAMEGATNGKEVVQLITDMLVNCAGTLGGAFMWITLIFALLERAGVKLSAKDGDFISKLPPVPDKKARIRLSEPIVALVFTALLAALFTYAPEWLGMIRFNNGDIIPIFNVSAIRNALPLILAGLGFGAVREVVKLIEGRYSIKVVVAAVVADAATSILAVIVFTAFPMCNPDLTNQAVQAMVMSLCPTLIVFANILDASTATYRYMRYVRHA